MSTDYRKSRANSQGHKIESEFVASPLDLELYPCLADLLCRFTSDGKRIKTATIAVWADDGRYKARVTDRHLNQTLWVTLHDPNELFSELESALTADFPDWRVDKRQYREQNDS